jgi:competence CoiA-like predicted nuclease
MLYAETEFGQKEFAMPGLRGLCPSCKQPLVAKCGRIKVWHWSHTNRIDCDAWFEPITPWHLGYQSLIVSSNVEVIFSNHRADLVAADRTVVELQHSPISPTQIEEREKFYGEMIWIVDAERFSENLVFVKKDNYYTFRWKWPRRSWMFAKKRVFLDLCNECLFEIKKIHPGKPRTFETVFDEAGNYVMGYYSSKRACAGWGTFIRKDEFIQRYFEGLLKPIEEPKLEVIKDLKR